MLHYPHLGVSANRIDSFRQSSIISLQKRSCVLFFSFLALYTHSSTFHGTVVVRPKLLGWIRGLLKGRSERGGGHNKNCRITQKRNRLPRSVTAIPVPKSAAVDTEREPWTRRGRPAGRALVRYREKHICPPHDGPWRMRAPLWGTSKHSARSHALCRQAVVIGAVRPPPATVKRPFSPFPRSRAQCAPIEGPAHFAPCYSPLPRALPLPSRPSLSRTLLPSISKHSRFYGQTRSAGVRQKWRPG